jgi:hypothetical protein
MTVRTRPMVDILLTLPQARQMLASLVSAQVDGAKWRRYRIAAAIPVEKRIFSQYDMTKISFVAARVRAGESLGQAEAALWRIIDPIEDGPDYEQRAQAAIAAELERLQPTKETH